MNKIEIVKKGNRIFYKVEEDMTEYYDLENLVYNHPELENYVAENKIELERVLMQQRELKQAHDTM